MTTQTKTAWQTMPVTDLFEKLPVGKRYDQRTVLPFGAVPVIDQGKSGVIGYHNNEPGISATKDNPVVTFANHTCQVTLQTRPFSVIQNVFPLKARVGVDPWFLYYRIKNAMTFQDYKGHWPDFVTLQYQIPSHEEQKRIAGVLAAFDEKIENNNRTIKTLEEMAQTIFKEYVVMPAKDGLPEGWEMQTIGDNFAVTAGLAYKAESIVPAGDGARPLMTMGSITVGRRYTNEQVKYYRGDVAQRYDLSSGDLLVASHDVTQERRFIGCPAIIHSGVQKPVQGNNLYALRGKDRSVNEFFYQLLLTPAYRAYILGAAKGSNIVFISKGSLEAYSFPMPPQGVLRTYLERANTLVSRIEIAYKENQKLATMRDLLLPRLMSGEIRV